MIRLRLRTCAAIALLVPLNLAAQGPESVLELGRRSFSGEAALHGRMVGHTQELPGDALRCANCHTKIASGAARSAPARAEDFGPGLGRDTLLARLPRRGGPASRFELASFCRVLRDGVDPAHVMLSQAMPRYELTARECEALWTYLTAP